MPSVADMIAKNLDPAHIVVGRLFCDRTSRIKYQIDR